MKAVLVSYSAKNLSKSDSSKISKLFSGYVDKSNKSTYRYVRKGFIKSNGGFLISKSTFIIPKKAEKNLYKLSKKGLKIKKWKIDIPKFYFLD